MNELSIQFDRYVRLYSQFYRIRIFFVWRCSKGIRDNTEDHWWNVSLYDSEIVTPFIILRPASILHAAASWTSMTTAQLNNQKVHWIWFCWNSLSLLLIYTERRNKPKSSNFEFNCYPLFVEAFKGFSAVLWYLQRSKNTLKSLALYSRLIKKLKIKNESRVKFLFQIRKGSSEWKIVMCLVCLVSPTYLHWIHK